MISKAATFLDQYNQLMLWKFEIRLEHIDFIALINIWERLKSVPEPPNGAVQRCYFHQSSFQSI